MHYYSVFVILALDYLHLTATNMFKNLYEKLIKKENSLSVIGLGYVGIPIAVSFAKKLSVIGFDIDDSKIRLYKSGIDPTKEVGCEAVKSTSVEFTSNAKQLKEASFHIIAVPTPVNQDHSPDLLPIEKACSLLGKNLTPNSVIVLESTVYPGVTEEICIPILEKESGLICGKDFKIGYSPERINPGDKSHSFEKNKKIVSAQDAETLEIIAKVYELVVKAGVYKAESIRIAEAAKVIENSQRDINIAFMNELSIIFNKMGIDTKSVLETASTKWNFVNFTPGLVGGHCIGVDPYYLTYKADKLGYHSQIILAGRRINDSMGKYVAEHCIKSLIKANKSLESSRVAILGFTFKENCPDTRNTKVLDIVKELNDYGINPIIIDPVASKLEVAKLYNLQLSNMNEVKNIDAIIVAVPHLQFLKLTKNDFDKYYTQGTRVLLDIKAIYNKSDYENQNYIYWRL